MNRLFVALAIALLCASAAGAENAGVARTSRCYVSYDGLIWRPPARGQARCDGPELQPHVATSIFSNRQGGRGCRVSFDGFLWYRPPAGDFAPLAATQARCDSPGKLTRLVPTVIPRWARPRGPTRAIFAVTSLQQPYSPAGMRELGDLAHVSGIPVTWLIADPIWLLLQRDRYAEYHRRFGDDVQTIPDAALRRASRELLSGIGGDVAVESSAAGRDIARDVADGERAFWGIAWNSAGVDGLADRGAPWGAYCADVSAYKQASAADCSLLGLEWTARDLTASYWSGREDIYSTDPDDLLVRGGFDTVTASGYARAIIDAYAAAGETQPIVVVAQQESDEMAAAPRDAPVLHALYDEAVRTGMHPLTLSRAAAAARTFAGAPRAIAFPVIAPYAPSAWTATIDFHDNRAAMTFAAGRTAPLRLFPYNAGTRSPLSLPVPEMPPAEMPQLIGAAAADGTLTLAFEALRPAHYGIAIWSDPNVMGWTSPNVYPAGRAGAVAVFDLPAGVSHVTLHCRACTSTSFPYSS